MSHMVIYMGISSDKIHGDTSEKHIDAIVKNVLSKYVYDEDAPEQGTEKIDWYEIGGRWEESLAALESAPSAYKAKSGKFAYTSMEEYDAICNNGNHGPYVAGKETFIPINGAYKKDIDLTAFQKLDLYQMYKTTLMVLNRDMRLDGQVPDEVEIIGDALYTKDDEHKLLAMQGESFEAWLERLGWLESGLSKLDLAYGSDAYIDLDGTWHDVNDVWAKWEAGGTKTMLKALSSDNPEEAACEELWDEMNSFIDSLSDNDYLLVIDGHSLGL